jgi:glyoxylase-like metal-dependent hydrolase (beta-lactamase superfamily II)
MTSNPGQPAQPVATANASDPVSIEVAQLQALLDRGARVTVLDVRSAADRAEWAIPGSVHVDAGRALRIGDETALASVSIPKDAPVVTVCSRGNSSKIAAAQLARQGYDAHSLVGGMKAWSLAWNAAELEAPNAKLIQVRRTGKGCLSYIVGSGTEAMVIDASLDPEIYVRLAAAKGWRITHVIDTHIHADHLSRSRSLAERTGAAFHLPEQRRARFPFEPLKAGAEIKAGAAKLVALHTPGHTLESMCYIVNERWLLSGDTLFIANVGRPDLKAADAAGVRERALLLHASLTRLFALDPSLLVLPCHTGEPVPFDHEVIGAALGVVRNAIHLPESAAAFADHVIAHIPEDPPNHDMIVDLNEAGELPAGDPADLEAGANRCAIS